ncbi:type 1 glutamine amidotransferase [Staphylococcus simiae]|uniref:type 1 glutamine amidotransferase n=1 Tax=Staphylococcus simiae TaxID=308354 RepID=UPI001A95A258|nr:type 1 glutamine amidotransferase [Staphylococcus simiae]MBO1199858.1 type 1 glutamine amidotransferase [Staphylococcus simiae]MBO1202285.1 type 1 glutamine amidotransferase [Staphylococcus simiae]MBO1204547.1 type 1 glutamine amidotransferase [Staphylococcus simiae]MBO1211917.1 type 1 glutamine amidotransferase [Staphylococcus simiae]MBO1230710.1 type 1 glutamine amidotransferase [Staphylococcus simiae]
MRINVLQHTPNEGTGFISDWAKDNGHEMYIYHPYFYNGILPSAQDTDLLIILGGPMSPNDSHDWIGKERELIRTLLAEHKPMFGACFGAQQITKALGYTVTKSPVKEVGWDTVYLKSDTIPDLPKALTALHWHEDMFQIPNNAELLFSSDHLTNQGFLLNDNVIGLQFHFEPGPFEVKEIVTNDFAYAVDSVLNQTPQDILNHEVPKENKKVMYKLLDYIVSK